MANDVEAELAQWIAERAFDRAATRALEVDSDEVYSFLVHHLGSESDSTEVFAQMGEDLFGAHCTVRT